MFHKLQAIRPLSGLMLEATFQDGSVKKYDVKPLLQKWPAFMPLQDVSGLFEQVRVDAGGYGISWNDDIDLSCDEIWENGVPTADKTA